MALRLGVDLGGTKIEIAAFDETGAAVLRERMRAPRDDYGATLRAIVDLVLGVEARLGRRGSVGIGIPGTLSPATGLIKNANSVWLIGRALDADLAALLSRPVRLANDANCFALSEATDGAAAGQEIVFGAILGTGVGAGVVVGGRVLTGANAVAGEWGHNPLPAMTPEEWPGPRCYCGRRGCIETFLSGPGLAADHARAAGRTLTAEEVAVRAAKGDPAAAAALDRYADRLARALGSVINLLDPQAIVLGGGLSNLSWLYETVPARWAPYIFSDRVDTQLLAPRHGDSSGVRGAAWLWRQEEAESQSVDISERKGRN